jgi:hypothetical protein
MLLEFTKVFLSAPPMAALITLIVLLLFRKEIAAKIRDLIKAPGTEFAQPQPQPSETNAFNEADKFEIIGEATTSQAKTITAKGHQSSQFGEPTVTKTGELPDILKDDLLALEHIKMAQKDPYTYVANYKLVSYALNYERIFQWIYGTQVKLLQHLALANEARSSHELSKFYGEHMSLGSTEYKMSTYMDFLKSWGLIAEDNDAVYKAYRITKFGRDFLRYIADQYPDHWDKKPN